MYLKVGFTPARMQLLTLIIRGESLTILFKSR